MKNGENELTIRSIAQHTKNTRKTKCNTHLNKNTIN